jgi:phosphate/sulfate permease
MLEFITWWLGIPSSSSHTLIGGFAGLQLLTLLQYTVSRVI